MVVDGLGTVPQMTNSIQLGAVPWIADRLLVEAEHMFAVGVNSVAWLVCNDVPRAQGHMRLRAEKLKGPDEAIQLQCRAMALLLFCRG